MSVQKRGNEYIYLKYITDYLIMDILCQDPNGPIRYSMQKNDC